jgi:GNAT superfamily N-acetyltransferase
LTKQYGEALDKENLMMIGIDISIREANLQDSQAIANILHEVGWYDQFQAVSPEDAQARIAERIARCTQEGTNTIFVAERLDEVVGYVSAHWYPHLAQGYDGYVSELFVHPAETGHGIGGRLLAAVDAEARKRGCTRLILMNRRIRESYQRGFYSKHGWHELSDAAFFTRKIS